MTAAEKEISQEAARAMLAALKEACGRLDELVRRVRWPNQDDVYAAVAGYEAIDLADPAACDDGMEGA